MALLAVAAAPVSHAKEFTSISVVGADGRSNNIRASSGTIDGLFLGLIPARPRGGYVRVYPFGPTGHVGIPGHSPRRRAANAMTLDGATLIALTQLTTELDEAICR